MFIENHESVTVYPFGLITKDTLDISYIWIHFTSLTKGWRRLKHAIGLNESVPMGIGLVTIPM